MTPDDPVFHLQAELIAENMFANLSSAITAIPQKLYEQVLIRLNENSDDKIDLQLLNSQIFPDDEIYDIIKSSLENLKTWFFDNIDSIFDGLNDIAQKGFFGNIWDDITNFFNEIGNKISQLIQNISSRIQTRSKIWMAFFTGYDKYQVIMSDNDNVCEKCQQMAGEFFDTSEAKIGINAPPFHPNCGCTIERKKTDANIDEPLTLSDPSSTYDRNAAIDYAKKWAYKSNPNFPSFDGDCANFISQCLLAGGFEMNGDWYCNPDLNPRALFDQNYNWKWSILWSGAKEQYEYLKNSNIVSEEVVITGVDEITAAINDPENPVKVGDVMYLKFDQDRPHHATIISKIEDGMVYFAAHTDSYDAKPLSQFFNDNQNGSAYILKIK